MVSAGHPFERAIAITSQSLRQLRRFLFWRGAGFFHNLLGTRIYELKWASSELFSDKIISNSAHPHRHWLLDQFQSLGSFATVLEIGCGTGVNLQLLSERFPLKGVCGVDVNSQAIVEATVRFEPLKTVNAKFHHGKANDLSFFPDKSIDVVFCDATLLYIGPDKIAQVFSEMKRVARKKILLLELHQVGIGWRGIHSPDGWLRDYVVGVRENVGEQAVIAIKVPTAVWPTGRWPLHGHLIIADVENYPN